MSDNWINVKTNPPKERKVYLVGWVGAPNVERMLWRDGWYWLPSHNYYKGKIDPDHKPTHYQELPMPPVEEPEEAEAIPKLGGFLCPHCNKISAYDPELIKEIRGEK